MNLSLLFCLFSPERFCIAYNEKRTVLLSHCLLISNLCCGFRFSIAKFLRHTLRLTNVIQYSKSKLIMSDFRNKYTYYVVNHNYILAVKVILNYSLTFGFRIDVMYCVDTSGLDNRIEYYRLL